MVREKRVENKANLAGIWFAGQEQAGGFYFPESKNTFKKTPLVNKDSMQ